MPDDWRLTAFGYGRLQSLANAISAARKHLVSYSYLSPLTCRRAETTKSTHSVFANLGPQHVSDRCVPDDEPETPGRPRRPIFTQAPHRFSRSRKL